MHQGQGRTGLRSLHRKQGPHRTDRTPRPTALRGRAQQAARPQGDRFRHLYGRRDEDCRKPGGRDLRQEAAAGVEQGSAPADEPPLDAHLPDLGERLQQQRSRAKRGRRPYMPTGDGPQRPLGSPAGEDQRLPRAVARRLAARSAQDFRRWSYGDRPHGGARDAGDTRTIKRQVGRSAWVVEADSKKDCDPSDQEWRVRRGAERLDEGARRRRRRKWLKAGGRDPDGQGLPPGTGPPQGGTGSPVLAKGCLHDGLELWGEKGVNRHGRGAACLIRSADAVVCAVANQTDAARVSNGLGGRLEKCGRERSGAKTRLLPFSRHHLAGQPSVEVLGGECRWGKARQGKDPLQRRTARKTLRTSLTRCTAWGKEPRHLRGPVRFQRLNATRRGASKDDGVHGHAASRQECGNKAIRIWLPWLKRRSPRPSDTWQGYTAVLERCKVARPWIIGRPTPRQAALKA